MTETEDPPLSRREARKEARCRAIVDVAAREFRQHGYAGVTMSGIAAAVGGSKGTLWGHFPSKDDLFIAVVDHLADGLKADFTAFLQPGADVETALRAFCGDYVKKIVQPDLLSFYRLIISDVVRFPQIGGIFYEHAIQRTRAALAEFLADAMEREELRPDDPVQAARNLISLCLSVIQQEALLGLMDHCGPEQLAERADNAVSLFLRGYAVEQT